MIDVKRENSLFQKIKCVQTQPGRIVIDIRLRREPNQKVIRQADQEHRDRKNGVNAVADFEPVPKLAKED